MFTTHQHDAYLLVSRLFLYNRHLSDTIIVWGCAWEARNNDSQVIRLCRPLVLFTEKVLA